MASLYRRDPSGPWWVDYTDAAGKRRRVSTKTTNKTVAQRILEQLQLQAAAGKFGLHTTSAKLSDLVSEYIAYLGRTDGMHQTNTEHRIRRVLDAAGWTQARQITQYRVETIVQGLTNERPSKAGQPLSLQTQAHYLAAMKGFTRWLVVIRKALATDPLAGTKKPSAQSDRRLVRRYLTPAEWHYLAQTPGATLYATAIQTGFRASELRQLRPGNLKPDHLALPGKATKNKQAAKQYITPELYQRLRGALPFELTDRPLAEMLREDLERARKLAADDGPIPLDFLQPLDSEGKVLDFHSLRHTCGAWLAIAGVNPKTIQAVMRHSSITLTLDTYGHLMPGAEQEAAAVLGQRLFS